MCVGGGGGVGARTRPCRDEAWNTGVSLQDHQKLIEDEAILV